MPVTFDLARSEDVEAIVALLTDDVLGSTREHPDLGPYLEAFAQIDADPNQFVIVGRDGDAVVATLQLSILATMTHGGATRAQIESVRVDSAQRGAGVGEAMCRWAIAMAAQRGCTMMQLTTDHRRPEAKRFYERLGFIASHHGMKLWL